MTIEELRTRLRAIESRIVGKEPRVTVVLDGNENYYVSARRYHGDYILSGEMGTDLDALLVKAEQAVAECDPVLLARTLGIEPITSEQAAAE